MWRFIEVEFDVQFGGMEFSRNNRSSGQKSLRCFPHCCEGKHRANGFCGAPIYATALLSKDEIKLDDVTIVGQIRPQNEPMLSKEKRPLKEQDVHNQIRSEENKRAELLPGSWEVRNETEDTYEVRITLNAALRSYDYCWKSNRWASGTITHVVEIILMAKDAEGNMSVISFACSQPFVVVSTKKSVIPVVPNDTSIPAATKPKAKPKPKATKAGRKCDAEAAAGAEVSDGPDESMSSGSEGNRTEEAGVAELLLLRRSSFIFDVQYHQELAEQGEQLRNLRRMGGWTNDSSEPPSDIAMDIAMDMAVDVVTPESDGWSPDASVGESIIVLPQFYKGC